MLIGPKFWPARSANTLEITQKNFHASGKNIGEIIWDPWGGGKPGFFPPCAKRKKELIPLIWIKQIRNNFVFEIPDIFERFIWGGGGGGNTKPIFF